MIGGALGEIAAHAAHASAPEQALWAAVAMGGMLAGSLGVPLTAILFMLEITRSLPVLLPVMLGCLAAYAVTSLIMPRSILTEKLSRRGYHLTREYGIDPLEIVTIAEIMGDVKPEECEPAQALLPDVYIYSDETSRAAVEKMATGNLTTLFVVDRESDKVCGRIGLGDLLLGRRRLAERESHRNRVFALMGHRSHKPTTKAGV